MGQFEKFLNEDKEKEIHVFGYGLLTRPRIQQKIKDYLADAENLSKDALTNKTAFRNLYNTLFGNGVLKVMMDAEKKEIDKDEKEEWAKKSDK